MGIFKNLPNVIARNEVTKQSPCVLRRLLRSRPSLAMTNGIFAFVLLAVIAITTAKAGGPFYTWQDAEENWTNLRWQNDTLEWYVDSGPISNSADNAAARQWIQAELNKWTAAAMSDQSRNSISTVAVRTVFKGKIVNSSGADVDIDAGNFSNYYNDNETRTIIVFDKDGAITESLGFDKNTTIGLSTPTASDTSGLRITKGIAVFNGLLLDNGRMSEGKFKATILHELGHLLNLDHSMVNYSIAKLCGADADCADGNYIPTMYPIEIVESQGILARDDIIALSWQNPSDDFSGSFCVITGAVYDAKEKPLKGVHVVAARAGEGETTAKVDVRGFVSGAFAPQCNGDSRYYLYGIVPGAQYQVTYEPVASEFKGASGFEPLQDRSPTGFGSGQILSPSGETTVSCDAPGKTIEMASVTIDTANPCSSNPSEPDPQQAAQTKSAKCGVMPPDGGIWQISAIFVMLALGAKLKARRMVVILRRSRRIS